MYLLSGGMLVLVCAVLFLSRGDPDPSSPTFVVAEARGVKITRGDLDAFKAHFLEQHALQVDQIAPARLAQMDRQLAQQRMVEELLLNEAGNINEKAIAFKADAQMAELRSHFPNEQSFEEQLARTKMTKDEMKKELVRKATIDELLKSKVPPPKELPTETLEKYYKDHPAEFAQPPASRGSHVLVVVPPGADATTKAAKKKIIDAARARVMKKEDFGKVAQEVSEDKTSASKGGDLGFIARGTMPPAFGKAVFQTKVGEVSPVFETQYGYHFLKITENKPASRMAFDQAKDIISKKLTNIERQKGINEYITGVMKSANVTYHLAMTTGKGKPSK